MKNYHIKCGKCGETSSIYANSIFEALEDQEHNHLCVAKHMPEVKIEFISKEGEFQCLTV